ncbi:MAG: ribosome recycling factor [Sphingobacteriales bacterium]|nr:MAG: ribosome recycling factor [Sphingobacteriales bacterium]
MSDLNKLIDAGRAQMEKALSHLDIELGKIRAGKASAQMLDGVFVDYYGASTPLSQIGTINTPDARTLVIQPWEKSMLTAIEKGITYANLGFNPQNDGTVIRITVPPLTEERRKQLVKMAKAEAEEGKITIRNIRKEINENIKKAVKGGVPEDDGKAAETKVQDLTDKHIAKVDEILKTKEKEILTV